MTFEEFIKEWNDENDFISVVTSGSTGSPKTIHLKKVFVEKSALRTIDFFNLTSGSLLHSCVSPDFIGGKMMAVRARLANARLSWEKPSNTPLISFPKNLEINLLAVVPSQMLYLLENSGSLPSIKNIIIGGAPIHPDLKDKIADSGLNAFETYGMTETASHIALRKINKENIPFKTLPGISVGLDQDGCLIINLDEKQRIFTNDYAELLSPHEFFIKGRRDCMIISGGRKINPVEIEEKISRFIDVPFFVSSIPDEKWGQKLVIYIENKSEAEKCAELYKEENLKAAFKQVLENWQVPKEIIYLNHLPKTPNGKIKRF